MSTMQEIKKLQADTRKLKERLTVESNDSFAKLERLESLCRQQEYWREDLKTLSNVPGLKHPQWYVVDIPFAYGETSVQANEVIISAKNAFVCTQVQSYFLIEDEDLFNYRTTEIVAPFSPGDAKGRVLPCSAFKPYIEGLKVLGMSPKLTFSEYGIFLSPFLPDGYRYPEFEFQLEVEGSGRFWASPKVPAAAFQGVDNPFYLGFEGVVENVDKLKVYAYPTTSVNLKGTVRFVFHGYSIGSDISIQDQIRN